MTNREAVQKKKELLDIVKNLTAMRIMAGDEGIRAHVMQGVLDEGDYVAASFDEATGEMMLRFKASGTESGSLDGVVAGDAVEIVRGRGENKDCGTLEIRNGRGCLGRVPNDIAHALSPLMDGNLAEITESHVSHVRMPSDNEDAALYVKAYIKLADINANVEDGCVVCKNFVSWKPICAQEVRVLTCDIPLHDAKLLFEVCNRIGGDDKKLGYGNYAETRDLMVYLEELVSHEPDRYGCLSKYYDTDIQGYADGYFEFEFKEIFLRRAVDEKDYYWLDKKRVTNDEWEAAMICGAYNWYEEMFLYPTDNDLLFYLVKEDECDEPYICGGYEASVIFAD